MASLAEEFIVEESHDSRATQHGPNSLHHTGVMDRLRSTSLGTSGSGGSLRVPNRRSSMYDMFTDPSGEDEGSMNQRNGSSYNSFDNDENGSGDPLSDEDCDIYDAFENDNEDEVSDQHLRESIYDEFEHDDEHSEFAEVDHQFQQPTISTRGQHPTAAALFRNPSLSELPKELDRKTLLGSKSPQFLHRSHSEVPSMRQWFSNSQAHRRIEEVSPQHARPERNNHQGACYSDGTGGNKDWNKAWQEALEMPLDSKSSRWERLAKLSADFKATAENYTRVIVMERNLPDCQKTVKPLRNSLGIAGGQKYLVAGIYIKFLIDHKKVYGSEEHAAKIGNHELRNANVIFSSSMSLVSDTSHGVGVGPVRVPLMVLIDFLGSRSLATSKLPVSEDTLVFGSDDAGVNIKRKDVALPSLVQTTPYQLMTAISRSLNLKPHLVSDSRGKLVQVDTCADLEGHLGTDGRLYVLDTARVMPAEAPLEDGEGGARPRWPTVKAAHLVYQLRPKVVLENSVALSSDAWSRFGAHSSTAHNQEVSDATRHLLDRLIPKFAESLLELQPFRKTRCNEATLNGLRSESFARDDDDLIPRLLHEAGINLRYMGRIYKHLHMVCGGLSEEFSEKKNLAKLWQELLLVEMVSRCVKHRIRCRCLSIRSARELSADHEFRGVFISEMNKCLSKLSSAQTALWHPLHSLQRDLLDRFGFFAHFEALPSCLPSHQNQRTFCSQISGRRLFKRLVSALGLYFLPAVYDQLAHDESEAGFESKRPLDVIDLVDVRPVVKQMAIVSHARAMLHYERALKLRAGERDTDGGGNNTRLLRLAAEEFKNSLRSLPDDTIERSRLANVMVQVASRSTDREESLLMYSKAIEILKSAVSICEAQKRRQALGFDARSSTAIGSVVTLLEAALRTFVRWATPRPLAVTDAPWCSSDAVDSRDSTVDIGCPPHSDKVLTMFLEPSSMTLVTAGVDRSVKAWDVSLSASSLTSSPYFSADSNAPHMVGLWSQRACFEDRVLDLHANTTMVAAASQDRRIIVFSLMDGTKLSNLQLLNDHVTCLSLTPAASSRPSHDSLQGARQFLACGTAYRKVLVFELFLDKNPELVRSVVVAHSRAISLKFTHECKCSAPLNDRLGIGKRVGGLVRAGGGGGGDHRGDDVLAAPPVNKPRLRRSSLGPSSHHFNFLRSSEIHQNHTTSKKTANTVDPSSSIHSFDPPSSERGTIATSFDKYLVVGLNDGSVLRWQWSAPEQANETLVAPEALAAEVAHVEVVAPPLGDLFSVSSTQLVRCTLVVKFFQVISENRINHTYQSSDELLEVVDSLIAQVRLLEDDESKESALPGLHNFKARLRLAMENAPSEEMALLALIEEFKQHLHNLLTYPSPSLCNMLALDLINGQVICATNKGLNRRALRSPSKMNRQLWPKLDRPFIHSDMDPHIPCYQIFVSPDEDVLFSVGKDRLLRVWDLKTATAVRCLPSFSSDVPLCAARGVIASVTGEKASCIRAWVVWG